MKPTGKITKEERGYFAWAIVLYTLRKFKLPVPMQITLSDDWTWTRHNCCICGTNFKPYVPTGTLDFPGSLLTDFTGRYPICDACMETECPDLYFELITRREKFDAELKSNI